LSCPPSRASRRLRRQPVEARERGMTEVYFCGGQASSKNI
jgi:hypothetical protein